MTTITSTETLDLSEIDAETRLDRSEIYVGAPHESTPNEVHPIDDYTDGQPYLVWETTGHDNATRGIAYDPKSDHYAVLSRDDVSNWYVKSVGDTLRGEHLSHTENFDEHNIYWWEKEAMMELVYGSQGIYKDSSYDTYEFSEESSPGEIRVRPVATSE
ncbi:hypothetical protein ACFQE1_00375 [Halobium palmae]|uniref:Uncharacterized protein n=1 Tax=Halobium palmae TaxID=1776492 RepID=A0ABD5RUH2_9EURY